MPDRRVILFDLDGCILDSTEPILLCLNEALAGLGLDPLPRHELARHVGPPLQHTVATILAERDAPLDLVDPLVSAYRDRYQTVSIELAASYPGMAELVTSLGESERLGVCTSKPARWAVPILEHLELAAVFELIAGPGPTEAEPKTVTLGRAIEELSPLDRAESIMIGDRHHDVDAARHHGLIPVGVTWGFGAHEELEDAGATAVVDSAAELASVIATTT